MLVGGLADCQHVTAGHCSQDRRRDAASPLSRASTAICRFQYFSTINDNKLMKWLRSIHLADKCHKSTDVTRLYVQSRVLPLKMVMFAVLCALFAENMRAASKSLLKPSKHACIIVFYNICQKQFKVVLKCFDVKKRRIVIVEGRRGTSRNVEERRGGDVEERRGTSRDVEGIVELIKNDVCNCFYLCCLKT